MALEKQVYHDNLDVDLLIDGNEWSVIEARVELTKTSKADYIDMIIAPAPETVSSLPNDLTEPAPEGLLGAELTLDVDTELLAGDRGEETRLFTGNLANLSTAAQGAWEALAFDPSQQSFDTGTRDSTSFMAQKINVAAAAGAEEEADISLPSQFFKMNYPNKSQNTPSGTRILSSRLAQLICEKAGMSSSDYQLHFGGETSGKDISLYFSEESVTISEALSRLDKSTNSVWWFDRYGVFHIGAMEEGQPIDAWKLQFITDTSAGMTTPNYRSVRIIGSGVVSEEGWKRQAMNEEDPIVLEENMSDAESQEGMLAEPTFTYKNMSIQTQEEAEAVRDKIMDNLRSQRASGTVTVVGMPEVRPYDVIKMPNTEVQPMGGNRYGVRKVIHKINNSDGFLTELKVDGLMNEQDVITSEMATAAANKYRSELNEKSLPEGWDSGISRTSDINAI